MQRYEKKTRKTDSFVFFEIKNIKNTGFTKQLKKIVHTNIKKKQKEELRNNQLYIAHNYQEQRYSIYLGLNAKIIKTAIAEIFTKKIAFISKKSSNFAL